MTTRTFDIVETKEIESLLNRLKNAGISEATAMAGIGYKNGAGTLVEARRVGLVKRSIFMALKGYLADNVSNDAGATEFKLSYEEAELMFDALRKAREIWPKREDNLKSLQARIAIHMSKL